MFSKVRIQFRLNPDSTVVVLMMTIIFIATTFGYLVWNQQEVSAYSNKSPQIGDQERRAFNSTEMRSYYLTTDLFNGDKADGNDGNGAGVCAQGYHFGSLWEIFDTSNLKYNTDLGLKKDDSGGGPPTYSSGWVRTGYSSDFSSTPGNANCRNWSTNDSGDKGSTVYLPLGWEAGGDFDIWKVNASACNLSGYVWCVEDYAKEDVYIEKEYLPIVIVD